MKLSIITINWNNATGLEKTLRSVESQTFGDFEHIIVDGASTDGSVDCIKAYAERVHYRVDWSSEPDKGIYNAMNKGIRRATGDYVQFLNSGDCLCDEKVVEQMVAALGSQKENPAILYGNMLKAMPNGTHVRDKCGSGKGITLGFFYHGCLNHSPAYIQRTLFDEYGLYDESLKICSDWKWYVQSIILGQVNPQYADIDVTLFDMTGISETNKDLLDQERTKLLHEMIPPRILADYESSYESAQQMNRLHRHPWAYKLVWFLERCLFKYEKLTNRKNILK